MTVSMESTATDSHAPVVQLLLTVSFSPSLGNLTILDLADIAALYRDAFPVFQQVSRAGPMSSRAHEAVVTLPMPMHPRIALSSATSRYQILFQDDRMSFGWVRGTELNEPNDYPGFSAVFRGLMDNVQRLIGWAGQRGVTISPTVGEIAYTDAFALLAGKPLSDIITLLNPDGKLPVTSFNYGWTQPWPNDREGYVEGLFAGPSLSPEGRRVATLETSARFNPGATWHELEAGFADGHAVITDTYRELVKPPSHAISERWQ